MKIPVSAQAINWLKTVQYFNKVSTWSGALSILILCIAYQPIYAASDTIGEMAIDGELIPKPLFDYYRGLEIKKFEDCSTTASKEKVIDLIVAAKQTEVEADQANGIRSVIENLQLSFSKGSNEAARKIATEEIEKLRLIQLDYYKHRQFGTSGKELHDEYQKRVRDRDPHITNVTIVRVMEIRQPAGRGWEEKLIELATLIKQGTSFEEAEAKYPNHRTKIPYQADRWVALDSLAHNIDSATVKAGDVYGLEKLLNREAYYDPMVKIYEVKHLSQVRLTDQIYSGSSPAYLWFYLSNKADERKKHVLMSELWSKYSITEDGEAIERVGLYRPCAKF